MCVCVLLSFAKLSGKNGISVASSPPFLHNIYIYICVCVYVCVCVCVCVCIVYHSDTIVKNDKITYFAYVPYKPIHTRTSKRSWARYACSVIVAWYWFTIIGWYITVWTLETRNARARIVPYITSTYHLCTATWWWKTFINNWGTTFTSISWTTRTCIWINSICANSANCWTGSIYTIVI